MQSFKAIRRIVFLIFNVLSAISAVKSGDRKFSAGTNDRYDNEIYNFMVTLKHTTNISQKEEMNIKQSSFFRNLIK